MYVVFECFIFQVQTTSVGVHEGKQGQAAVIDTWRRCKPLLAVWRGCTSHAVLCARGGASLLGSVEETGAALVWKRWGQVIQATWAADLKRAVRMRARETELERVARESERIGQSSRGCPDESRRSDVQALALSFLMWLLYRYCRQKEVPMLCNSICKHIFRGWLL
jgi:hypothetical protein